MKAHLVGIKGVGMTALALILKEKGWRLTGSDVAKSFITDQALAQAQIPVYAGFDPNHLTSDLDLVIYSGAYRPQTHPELKQALQLGLKLQTQQEALADLVRNRHLIAVAGVGGKTTTSALLAHLFRTAGKPVGFFVGAGQINGQPQTGSWGADPVFVTEADEYANNLDLDPTPKLLLLKPQEIVFPNLQYDHPDIYQSPEQTLSVFTKFVQKLPPNGRIYFNQDNEFLTQLLTQINQPIFTESVGFNSQSDWHIQELKYQAEQTLVTIFHEGKKYELSLLLFGNYNARNAVLAAVVGLRHGLKWSAIQSALASFKGVGRRQEFKGKLNGALFYDDYGHHPAEIKATLTAFKQRFPQRRLWLFFESHTYTRTFKLLPDFIEALSLADKLTILPIFASARENPAQFNFTTQDFVNALKKSGQSSVNFLEFAEAPAYLQAHLQPNDLILTMGAGVSYQLHDKFLSNTKY